MEIKSIYPIIAVENLEATKKFYCETLNFKVKHSPVRNDGGHVLILSNDCGVEIEIMEITKNIPVKMNPGIFGLRMNVDDIESAINELKDNGYEPVGNILVTEISKNIIVKDNNGVSITLIQHIKK